MVSINLSGGKKKFAKGIMIPKRKIMLKPLTKIKALDTALLMAKVGYPHEWHVENSPNEAGSKNDLPINTWVS